MYRGEQNRAGEREGKGSYTWSETFSYSGEWSAGRMHGHGVMRVGDSYVEGEFKCGEIEGFCVRTWSEADGAVRKRYRGSFVRGEMHGRGELCTRTERYVGEFVRNKRQGSGALTVAGRPLGEDFASEWRDETPGDRLEGTWLGNKIHGQAELAELSGHAYSGEYVLGARSGRGRASWAGGATYEGEWLDDARHGAGKYACAQSGIEYEGAWASDAPVARGAVCAVSCVAAPAPSGDAKPDKGKKKKDKSARASKDEAAFCQETAVLTLAPGEALPALQIVAQTDAGLASCDAAHAANAAVAANADASARDEEGSGVASSVEEACAEPESGRTMRLSLRRAPRAAPEEEEGEAEAAADRDAAPRDAWDEDEPLAFFWTLPTLSEVSLAAARVTECGGGARVLEIVDSAAEKKKGAVDCAGLVGGNDCFAVPEPLETLQTAVTAQREASAAAACDDEPAAFPPALGCAVALDFLLSTQHGALAQAAPNAEGLTAPPEQTPLLAQLDAAQQPLLVSLRRAARGEYETAASSELCASSTGDCEPSEGCDAETALDAVLVVRPPAAARAEDSEGVVFEFAVPAFVGAQWHSLAVALEPSPTTCARFGVGGSRFCGGCKNVVLFEQAAPAARLDALTACYREFYADARERACADARQLADWETAWTVAPDADAADAAALLLDEEETEAATKNAPKKTPNAKKGEQQPELSASASSPKLKDDAPEPPELLAGATRVLERVVTLSHGKALARGLRLSQRMPPGAYLIRVTDVSRDGEMQWSETEQHVFPTLPDAQLPFQVT